MAKLAKLRIGGGGGYATADICEIDPRDMIALPAIRILDKPERLVDLVLSLLGGD